MKEDRKKEIEAKFLKLIAESEKPKKTKPLPSISTTSTAKVIRRRKGRPDLHIT